MPHDGSVERPLKNVLGWDVASSLRVYKRMTAKQKFICAYSNFHYTEKYIYIYIFLLFVLLLEILLYDVDKFYKKLRLKCFRISPFFFSHMLLGVCRISITY